MCGRIMIGLSLSSVNKHNMWSYYENIMIGLSLLSSVSKHNMWWYYGWVCRRLSVSMKCGIPIGFIVVFVRQ
jgi:hypothetical protein